MLRGCSSGALLAEQADMIVEAGDGRSYYLREADSGVPGLSEGYRLSWHRRPGISGILLNSPEFAP